MSPELKNKTNDYSKNDLWSIGILLYYISMKGNYPFTSLDNYSLIEKTIKNGILYESLKENCLANLIINLLKYNKNERLDWNNYFNYSINNNIITKNLDLLGKNRKPISKNEIDNLFEKVSCICKIEYFIDDEILQGSGFFVELEKKDIPIKYALFTNNYILNENNIKINKIINITTYKSYSNYQNRTIKITEKRIAFTNKELDFTCIQLFESDGIKNYFKIDYNIFDKNNLENEDIFLLKYPSKNDISFSLGKILSFNDNKIRHSATIQEDFSGSPIIRRNKYDKNYKIIGLDYSKHNNKNNLIKIKDNIYESNLAISFNLIINYIIKEKINKIIGIFNITNEDINKKIRIINSFEKYKKEYKIKNKEDDYKFENKKEIKENIKIKINNEYIDFTYFYKFKEKGEYKIEYSFYKDKLQKLDYLFCECYSLKYLYLSNFNTEDIINISYMFYNCSSLIYINLLTFNTKNVTDMSYMFSDCISLKDLDLSKFNTEEVINMSYMFYNCSSLKNVDLSNFNTQNVTDMSYMFYNCNSFEVLDLSKFNAQNVIDINHMFYGCSSLFNVDLSKFNSKKIINISYMFYNCSSLKNIDLSKINSENITDMSYTFYNCCSLRSLDLLNFDSKNCKNMNKIFYKCSSLKIQDLNTRDEQIIDNFINNQN